MEIRYIDELKSIFQRTNDLYLIHKKSAVVLLQMAKDKTILYYIIKKNLLQPGFLKKTRHHPIIAFTIEENKDFTFIMHCYLPLPNRVLNVSHQSIHHHGNLLLTTVAAFGDGYESVLFKKGFKIDKNTGETTIEIDKVYKNHIYNLEFIDAYTPHVVFFPATLSVTLALWSNNKKHTTDSLKQIPLLQKFKNPIIKLVNTLRLSKALGLNIIEYFDFYVKDNKIFSLRERIFGYKPGTNENFLQNLFYILQEVGFDDIDFLLKLKSQLHKINDEKVFPWIDALIQKEKIKDLFEPQHLNIDKVNLTKEKILSVFK